MRTSPASQVQDFTEGSVVHHILMMAAPVALGMVTQIIYQLINLYLVTNIGAAATAGVSAAGNVVFAVGALCQMLSVGTVTLVSHAVGRKEHAETNRIFNQSLMFSAVLGVLTIGFLFLLMPAYMRSVAADEATVEAGTTYILWGLPGYASALPAMVLSSALRGIGIVRPLIVISIATVTVDSVLAPILIAGWGTGVALGVKGAGLATSISSVIGLAGSILYLYRGQQYFGVSRELLAPKLKRWWHILEIGLPVGADIALYFVFNGVVFYMIRDFGAAAQAGFGIGSRIVQTIVLPGLSIAYAVGPIAGQSLGARNSKRVRETFCTAVLMAVVVMAPTMALIQWRPHAFVSMFDADATAVAAAIVFLQLTSWSFIALVLVSTCSSMFQGLGNTVPSMLSSGVRFLGFTVPLVLMSMHPAFRIEHVWYIFVASLMLQAIVSLWFLHVEFRKRLPPTVV